MMRRFPAFLILAAGILIYGVPPHPSAGGEVHYPQTIYRDVTLSAWAPTATVGSITVTNAGAFAATGTWHYALAAQGELGTTTNGPVTNATITATGQLVRIRWTRVLGSTNTIVWRGASATTLTNWISAGTGTNWVDYGTNAWTAGVPSNSVTASPRLRMPAGYASSDSNDVVTKHEVVGLETTNLLHLTGGELNGDLSLLANFTAPRLSASTDIVSVVLGNAPGGITDRVAQLSVKQTWDLSTGDNGGGIDLLAAGADQDWRSGQIWAGGDVRIVAGNAATNAFGYLYRAGKVEIKAGEGRSPGNITLIATQAYVSINAPTTTISGAAIVAGNVVVGGEIIGSGTSLSNLQAAYLSGVLPSSVIETMAGIPADGLTGTIPGVVVASSGIMPTTSSNSFAQRIISGTTTVNVSGGTATLGDAAAQNVTNPVFAANRIGSELIANANPLATGQIYVRDAVGGFKNQTLSGDVTMNNTGAITVTKLGGVNVSSFPTFSALSTSIASMVRFSYTAPASNNAAGVEGTWVTVGSGANWTEYLYRANALGSGTNGWLRKVPSGNWTALWP